MQGDGAAASAQGIRTLQIGNRTVAIGKLTFKDLASCKEQACKEYKRAFLQTYLDNMDLIPEADRVKTRQEVFSRAEEITADSLPPRKTWVADTSRKLQRHKGDRVWHSGAQIWINDGDLIPVEIEINYVGWWMSQTPSGRLFVAWLSMRNCKGQEHWTLDDVMAMNQDADMSQVAEEIGDLNQSHLGNDPAPAEGPKA